MWMWTMTLEDKRKRKSSEFSEIQRKTRVLNVSTTDFANGLKLFAPHK